jgi:hypothetical protein
MNAVLNLASPEQTAARLGRMIVAKQSNQDHAWDLAVTLRKIKETVRTEADAIQALHAISAGLMNRTFVHPSSGAAETVGSIDSLADEIQYRDAAA